MPTTNDLVRSNITNQAAQQVEQINAAFGEVDAGVRGTVAVTGSGTIALTAAQAQYALVKVSGDATIVTIPDITGKSRPFKIWNATGGAITFKTVSGTGVDVEAGVVAEVWCDTDGLMHLISGGGTGTGAGCVREVVEVTTASIDPLGEDTLTAPLGESGTILNIATDVPARVRIYHTAAARTADAARPLTTDGTSGKGLLAEVATGSALLSIPLSPPADYWNGDESGEVVYLAVASYYDVVTPVKVTLTFVANPVREV